MPNFSTHLIKKGHFIFRVLCKFEKKNAARGAVITFWHIIKAFFHIVFKGCTTYRILYLTKYCVNTLFVLDLPLTHQTMLYSDMRRTKSYACLISSSQPFYFAPPISDFAIKLQSQRYGQKLQESDYEKLRNCQSENEGLTWQL